MSAEVGLGLGRGVRLARLIDRDDAKLIPLALAEAGHPRLQLVNRGHAVLVVRDEGVKPAAEFVFLLDDVVGDGTPAVVLGLVPSQCHGFVVKVHNFRLARGAGRS